MASTKFEFDFQASELGVSLKAVTPKMESLIRQYCEIEAIRLVSYMQKNRPWTDRTGMAKATLRQEVSQPREFVTRIALSHGVDYGIWLELANEKNYAIIAPTIRTEGPRIIQGLQGMLTRVK